MAFIDGLKLPYVQIVLVMVGGASIAGISLGVRNLRHDPQLAWYNKHENRYPWLDVPQNRNLKLINCNRKFEDSSVKETFMK